MAEKFYNLAQLSELLDKPLFLLVNARSALPVCPNRRDEYGRNLYGRRDVSLFHRYLIERDDAAATESSPAARAAYIDAIAPAGAERHAALEAEFMRIVCGEVESTNEQENAL